MRRFPTVPTDVTFPSMAAWQSCRDCSGGPQPGARALLAYWLETTDPVGTSMGIYNCRPVRGATSLSMHACGRAIDLGVPVNGVGHRVAYQFLRDIAPHSVRLGVQYVIFNRVHWSARRAPAGEPYHGAHPHYDHIHLELNVEASARLTLATLRSVVGTTGPWDPPIPPGDLPESSAEGALEMLPVINFARVTGTPSTWQGTPNAPRDVVRSLQGLLMAGGFYSGRLDGIGGPMTRDAVGALQGRFSTGRRGTSTPDYVVGERSWRAALAIL